MAPWMAAQKADPTASKMALLMVTLMVALTVFPMAAEKAGQKAASSEPMMADLSVEMMALRKVVAWVDPKAALMDIGTAQTTVAISAQEMVWKSDGSTTATKEHSTEHL